jgi:hypothetical protein
MAANSTLLEERSSNVSTGISSFERVCQLTVLLLGARCAYSGRYLPAGADGLAYLDVARSYVAHDWHTALNGYWGPLYAWLLALVMWIFRPGIHSEFALARALNFALFATALYTFGGYWRGLIKWSKKDWSKRISPDAYPIPVAVPLVWTLLGYLLFLLNFVWSVDVINPDILVAAMVFAIASFLMRLSDHARQGWHGLGSYAWLGLLLAAGYYAKAIMLYFAIFVLGAMFIRAFRSRRFAGPLTAILVFGVLVSPFIAIISKTLGHFTAGDSGRLNYAWFVDGPETKTWENNSPDSAPVPFYPGPTIFQSPRVFRIPVIQGVTYAPWYDASRFDQRSRPFFNLRDQLRQLALNLRYSRETLVGEGAALTVPLLILLWYEPKASARCLAATWFFTLPALAVFGMYLLVHLVERFVLGFSLLLWGAVWASVYVPASYERQLQSLARRAVLAAMIVMAAYAMPGLLHYAISRRTESVGRDMVIAEALPRYGLAPGDVVASIGDGQEAYWAHFARLSVVVEVWRIDAAQFWSAQPAVQEAALRSMGAAGAKAAVWRADSNLQCPGGWQSLPESSGCIVSLH